MREFYSINIRLRLRVRNANKSVIDLALKIYQA